MHGDFDTAMSACVSSQPQHCTAKQWACDCNMTKHHSNVKQCLDLSLENSMHTQICNKWFKNAIRAISDYWLLLNWISHNGSQITIGILNLIIYGQISSLTFIWLLWGYT